MEDSDEEYDGKERSYSEELEDRIKELKARLIEGVGRMRISLLGGDDGDPMGDESVGDKKGRPTGDGSTGVQKRHRAGGESPQGFHLVLSRSHYRPLMWWKTGRPGLFTRSRQPATAGTYKKRGSDDQNSRTIP